MSADCSVPWFSRPYTYQPPTRGTVFSGPSVSQMPSQYGRNAYVWRIRDGVEIPSIDWDLPRKNIAGGFNEWCSFRSFFYYYSEVLAMWIWTTCIWRPTFYVEYELTTAKCLPLWCLMPLTYVVVYYKFVGKGCVIPFTVHNWEYLNCTLDWGWIMYLNYKYIYDINITWLIMLLFTLRDVVHKVFLSKMYIFHVL